MLRYVCKYCGDVVSEHPHVANAPDQSPNVISVCDKPKCRAQASTDYKRTA